MVTLINKSGKIKVYNLDHDSFRQKQWGARRMTLTVIEQHRDGGRYPRQLRRNLAGSLTLLAGERREGLPPQIQAVPEIRKAIRKGVLECVKEKPQEAVAAESAVTPETPATQPTPAPVRKDKGKRE